MKNLLIVIFLLFNCYAVFGQANFQEGYVVTINNDTIRGEIDFRGGLFNINNCIFKNPQGNTKIYNSDEILGYSIINSSHHYIAKEVQINEEEKHVFLQELVEGPLTLYIYNFAIFFLEKNDKLYKLQSNDKTDYANGRNIIIKDTKYIGILSSLTSECDKLKKKVYNTSLSQRALTKLVINYNNCVDPSTAYEKSSERVSSFRYGLFTSYVNQNLNFSSSGESSYLYLTTPQFQSEGAEFGVNLLWQLGWLSSNLNTEIGLSYRTSNAYFDTGRYRLLTNWWSEYFIIYYTYFDYDEIRIPLSFQYNFNNEKVRPFVSLGISYSRIINLEESIKLERLDPGYLGDESISRIRNSPEVDISFAKFQIGVLASAGIYFPLRKLNPYVKITYERHSGLIELEAMIDDSISSKGNNLYLTLGLIVNN